MDKTAGKRANGEHMYAAVDWVWAIYAAEPRILTAMTRLKAAIPYRVTHDASSRSRPSTRRDRSGGRALASAQRAPDSVVSCSGIQGQNVVASHCPPVVSNNKRTDMRYTTRRYGDTDKRLTASERIQEMWDIESVRGDSSCQSTWSPQPPGRS